ncbi:hypothetical protein [Methylobacterium sp. Leaf118]|uniref:hypothetical protein n=1 Tax=Methylobacterium sp. Leaf118 TaxID=2876562 RepID=UPI001E38C1D8|nr:hypothetical protein [Methylobacterium sp. Leaf118]
MTEVEISLANQIKLAPNSRFVIFADERDGAIASESFEKISFIKSNAEKMGLIYEYDTPWRCGDYAFYIVRGHFPMASQFWLIEPDVYIHSDEPENFFKKFSHCENIDMISARYSRASEHWAWYKYMAFYHSVIYTMMFPVVRLSGRAVDYLFRRRIALGRCYAERKSANVSNIEVLWPNDESFVATELSNANFVCMDMNDIGSPSYLHEYFGFQKPVIPAMLPENAGDLVCHPFVHGDKLYAQATVYVMRILESGVPWSESDKNYVARLLNQIIKEQPENAENFRSLLEASGWTE